VPLRWSEGENVRWKVPIAGVGWSSPVVLGGQVWMTSATADGRELSVVSVSLAKGEEIHRRVVIKNADPEPKHDLNSYASPSPVIEAGRVYAHFGSYGTVCLNTQTGETLWERRDLPCDHVTGPGSSPFLYGGLLVVHMDGADVQYVIALDKETGETRWKAPRTADLGELPRDMRRSFSTPIVVTVDGRPQLISTGSQATYGYDPKTGQQIWRLHHKGFSNCSRPVSSKGVVYLNTGFERPLLIAVRPEGTGDLAYEDVVEWSCARSVPKVPSPLLIGDSLYMVSDGGIATCLDAKTGRRHWKKRIGGEHSASLVHANGRIYSFDREGRTVVIQAAREYKELGVNQLDGGFMASPAIVGDAFILRTREHLYRIEKSGG